MSPLGGLHVKHAVQYGIWVPTHHLLWDQGKPWKTLFELADHRTCGAPSLTRSLVCSFQFLLVIVSTTFLRSESHETHEQGLSWATLFLREINTGTWPSRLGSLKNRDLYFTFKFKFYCDQRSVSQFVFVSGPFGADDQILHFFQWQLLSFFFV
jgi:hypothetical protein